MAHSIDYRNGRFTFAFTGERARIWHGLGQQVAADASVEEWKQASGLDFKVLRSKVRYETARDGSAPRVWDDQHVLFRSDSREPIAVVSDGYQIVQPADAFAFFQRAAGDLGLSIDTAGALKQGKKFFASAKFDDASVVPGDAVEANLLFATSCDGSMNTVVSNVATRVVCANTLAVALGESNKRTVRVSHRSVFDGDKVLVKLGLAVDGFAKFIADAREFSRYSIAPAAAHDLIAQVFGAPVEVKSAADQAKVEKVLKSAGFNKVLALFAGEGRGAQLRGVQNTAWGVLNAVTQYVDHEVRATSDDNRRDSAWFGPGADLKDDAYALIRSVVFAD
jgi:phage/plasmid-like protein (TIGR03299 family)